MMVKETHPRHPCRIHRLLVGCAAVASVTGAAHADISFTDFTSTPGLSFVGSAAQLGSTLRLTPATERVAGAAWFTDRKQRVADGFETQFSFRISDITGRGADGLAFVIQNSSATALGGTGGGIGYGTNTYFDQPGISDCLAIELDTWDNSLRDWADLNDNHVSIQTCGPLSADPDQSYSQGCAPLPVNVSDGRDHLVRISYAAGVMRVYLDRNESPLVESTLDLKTLLNLDDGSAWVGFTSATGGPADVEAHSITSWTFHETPVPTPGTVALLGFAGLALCARRPSMKHR